MDDTRGFDPQVPMVSSSISAKVLRINTFPLLHFPVAAKLPEMHGPGLRRRAAQVFELGHSCFPPNGLYIFYTSYYLINLSNSSNGLYTSISMRDLPLD